jgi:phosphate transport system substrate-binding protein
MMTAAVLSVAALAAPVGLGQDSKLSGSIKADGSSTVFLITEAMAANFNKLHPNVKISVAFSGTGGGFKKFANGETDISNASRAIKSAEAEKCKEKGINYVELQVAWDGLAVVINPENTWARKMTVEQLKKIWHPNSDKFKNAKTWKDVDPSWPDEEIKLFGAGADSGTFDYFTEAINGKEKVIRPDFTPSEDDNVIANGVIRNKYAMGFFGVAYYVNNKDKLGVVAVENPKDKESYLPTPDNVISKKYQPLSRPLFIYVRTDSLKRGEVQEFVNFYVRRNDIVRTVNYVPLNAVQSLKTRQVLDTALKGIN